MRHRSLRLAVVALIGVTALAAQTNYMQSKLIIVDPGHFHATLLQKEDVLALFGYASATLSLDALPQAEAKGPFGLLRCHWVADALEQMAHHGCPQLTAAIDQRRSGRQAQAWTGKRFSFS